MQEQDCRFSVPYLIWINGQTTKVSLGSFFSQKEEKIPETMHPALRSPAFEHLYVYQTCRETLLHPKSVNPQNIFCSSLISPLRRRVPSPVAGATNNAPPTKLPHMRPPAQTIQHLRLDATRRRVEDCQQCGAWPELKLADASLKPAGRRTATATAFTRLPADCSFAFGHGAPLVSSFENIFQARSLPEVSNFEVSTAWEWPNMIDCLSMAHY